MEVERLVDVVDEQLEIRDDSLRELAKARVILVIARVFDTMTPSKREYATMFVDEEIPCYWEAKRRYDELNQ